MSDSPGNENQGTQSADQLEAQIAADEAARNAPEVAAAPESPAEPEPEPQESEPEETEFEKRISRLAYEKRQAEKQNRELQAKLDRMDGKAPPLPQDEQVQQEVERRAAELAAAKAFNDRANSIYMDGVNSYPDFEQKLGALREMGGMTMQLVEAVDEVGDPHKLLYWLAKNIDEAERISKLPPHKMGAALAKVANKMNVPPPQSKAPAPITPISGNSKVENWETMPLDEYMRREDERWANRRRH
jgi:hypothetical protein